MDTFIPVFLTLIGVMLVALTYLACTAPFGWEDADGFHPGVRGHSAHNGQAISAGGRKDHGAQH